MTEQQQINGNKSSPGAPLLARAIEAFSRGDAATAAQLARSATELAPLDAYGWGVLCVSLHRLKDAAGAIEAGRKAVALNPASAEHHNNLGVALRAAGRLREAEAEYLAALAVDPRFTSAHGNLGNLARDEFRSEDAERHYRAALALKPDGADLWQNLAGVLQRRGRMDEGGAALEKALALAPSRADILTDYAMYLAARNQMQDGANLLIKAIELNPNLDTAHGNLGALQLRSGQLMPAQRSTRRAFELAPNEQRWLSNLGVISKDLGRFDEAETLFRRALALKPDYAVGHANLLFCLNYHPDKSAEEIFAEYQRFDAAHARPHMPASVAYANTPLPDRRLRVGFLSPDFREHAARHFLEPLLENYDRSAIELFCFAEVPNPDFMTERFKSLASHWRSTVGLTDDEVAEQIRKDTIDIMVDFGGHTSSSRLLALARRPAPIQVAHHLGHGYTSGMSSMDVFLSDQEMAPVGAEHLFAEKRIVRLSRIPVAYSPPSGMPAPSPVPALKKGHITFGYFGRTERINDRVVKAWADILKAVPSSRLMLNSRPFNERDFCDMMADRFAAHGVARDRLELVYTQPQPRTWDAYSEIDIALDPFPHNAGTTTIEAAYLGVPVVSVLDRPSVGRFGASNLAALGMQDWVAPNVAAYVDLAVEKSRDVQALAKLRESLRARFLASPLSDGKGLTREIERAFRALWIEWCARQSATQPPAPAASIPAAMPPPEALDAVQRDAADAFRSGDKEKAVLLFGELARIAPTASSFTNYGVALRNLGRSEEAEAAYRAAIAQDPNFTNAHGNLGNLLSSRGREREAEASYRRALELSPGELSLMRNLGLSLMRQQRLKDAEPLFRAILEKRPGDVDTLDNLAQLMRQLAEPIAALRLYERAGEALNGNWRALGNYALLLEDMCRFEEAEEAFRKALALNPGYALAHGNLLFCMNYHPDKTAEEIFAEYQRFDAKHARPFTPAGVTYTNDRTQDRRLRIGYLSPDFREHAARHFLEPLLANHDAAAIEVVCYAEVPNPDATTERFKKLASQWRSTVGLTDDEVANLIRKDAIDIMVDFGGHTSSSRLLALARRPAPIQIAHHLGHGYTSGMSSMDVFVSDAEMAPKGAEHLFAEKHIVRLARIPVAYAPPAGMPEPSPLPALSNGYVTFGYFGRTERINDRVVKAWAEILLGLPKSRLMLNSKPFNEREFCDAMASRFARYGIARDRLRLCYTTPQPVTWAAYSEVDIALDPFPHNAGTTTIEAMYLGVPVVSVVDRPSVGRFGASNLAALGLTDWLAKDVSSYVDLAIRKARDFEALAALRASLRARFNSSPLADGKGLAREMEGAYRSLWIDWCKRGTSGAPATRSEPGYGDAYAAFNAKDFDKAARITNAMVSRDPANVEALHLLGVALYKLGRTADAVKALLRAAPLDKTRADIRWNLTAMLRAIGRLPEAEVAGREAVQLAPNSPEAHNNLASVYKDMGRHAEAERHYRRAIEAKPEYSDAWTNLAWLLAISGNVREAEAASQRAIALNPRDANAYNNLGTALMQQDRLREAGESFAKAVELKTDFAIAHSNQLFCLNYRTDLTGEQVFAEYRKWDAQHGHHLMPANPVYKGTKDPNRRLKIGYVSPDFRYHAVSFFIEPFVAAHDPKEVEVTCYAEVLNPDGVTERFMRHAHRWRRTVGMSDEALAQQIREDEIDILIDLAGHTGGNRLLTFARKPAPVQVAHMVGAGTTTGLSAMDGFLINEALFPTGYDHLFSERPIRLSRMPHVYAPPPGMPEVAPLPALRKGYVTFGCFSRAARINEDVIAAWARILRSTPNSRLLLNSKPFREELGREAWRAKFKAHKVDPERIEMVYTSPQPKTWEAYGEIDIALDPFPHNAGTTTIEALWLGVPVVSLTGRPPVGRFGASILGSVKLDDWVTSDVDSYVARAIMAASNIAQLATLRKELRKMFRDSPIGSDAAGLAREIEGAYRMLWREYCARP